MKFTVKKKLNLSRIDKELWPYEDETFEITDADSFEEAQIKVDKYYAEREGFHRGIAESKRAEKAETKVKTVLDKGTASEQEVSSVIREPEISNNQGETAGPPKEFN